MTYLIVGVLFFLCGYCLRSLRPQQTTIHVRVPSDGQVLKVVHANIKRGGELRQLIQDVSAQ